MSDFDITGQIGPLFHLTSETKPAEWPMYSFDRPSHTLWNAIGERLSEKGWTEKQIKDWLQSEQTRWALDGSLGDAIRDLGRTYADSL